MSNQILKSRGLKQKENQILRLKISKKWRVKYVNKKYSVKVQARLYVTINSVKTRYNKYTTYDQFSVINAKKNSQLLFFKSNIIVSIVDASKCNVNKESGVFNNDHNSQCEQILLFFILSIIL